MNRIYFKIILFLLCVFILTILYQNGSMQYLNEDFLQSVLGDNAQYVGIIFILFYTLITVLFIPVGPFVIFAGVFFGAITGMIYVFIGAVLGAIISLFISRYFFYDLMEKVILKKFPNIKKYQEYIENDKNGSLFLLRLTPIIPSNILNYTCGLTKVPLRTFIWTMVGVLPGTFFYTYLGESLTDIMPFNIAILVLLTLMMLILTYFARKRLPQRKKVLS